MKFRIILIAVFMFFGKANAQSIFAKDSLFFVNQKSIFEKPEKSILLLEQPKFQNLEVQSFYFKNKAVEKPIDLTNQLFNLCYPKTSEEQMKIVVVDYFFNKYVVQKLIFGKKE